VDVGPLIVADAQDDGIDWAKRTSARRPGATAPSGCPVSCGAWPATAEGDGPANRGGCPPRHSLGRRARQL